MVTVKTKPINPDTETNTSKGKEVKTKLKSKVPRIIGKKQGNEEVVDLLESLIANDKDIDYIKPIDDLLLKQIKEDVTKNFTKEVLSAPSDDEIRSKLVQSVYKNHKHSLKGSLEAAEYVVRETVGTGVIEKLLQNDSITDMGWNGKLLSIKTNDTYLLIKGEELGITSKYIEGIISKYAVANDSNFNTGSPIFDGMFKNIRINAVHEDNSPIGATLSLRRAKPQLALNRNNFADFAPMYILDLLEKMVLTKSNVMISGDPGTGKTELQKLMISFVLHGNKVIMIEDVQETHVQILFPELEVYSWLTSPDVKIADLVVSALRNTPDYLNVSEIRRADEARELMVGIVAGQCTITTVHAARASAIPRRLVGMIASDRAINEESLLKDIYSNFNFGMHIKKIKIDGKTRRYLNEIIEFNENGHKTIFEQKFINGEFKVTKLNNPSEEFQEKLGELFLDFQFPED